MKVAKTKFIKFFIEKEIQTKNEDGEFETQTVKTYLHPEGKAVHASVRQLASFELNTSGATINGGTTEFIVNQREISVATLIEFNGRTYEITFIDKYDFTNGDMKVQAKEIPAKEYSSVEYAQVE